MANRFSPPDAYYGMYLNMARHNAFLILEHISNKFCIEDEMLKKGHTEDKGELRKANILAWKTQNITLHRPIVEAIAYRLPWLQTLLDGEKAEKNPDGDIIRLPESINFKEFYDTLTDALHLLHHARNYFSHHYSVTTDAPFDLTPFYKAAIVKLSKRYETYQDARDLELVVSNSERIINNLVPSVVPNGKIPLINEKTLVYFTCLFLEPKYTSLFLGQLRGFKKTEGEKYSATLDTYRMFCCRLPYPRLESADILLDMMNELGRCPKVLYPLLGEKDRDTLAEYYKQPTDHKALKELDREEIYEGQKDAEVKRHDDRFPYFALRYFEDMNVFETLRFQIRLGRRIVKPPYEKIVDGEVVNRKLLKSINRFGKLSEFEALPPVGSDWKVRKDEADQFIEKSDLQFFAPHYNFLGDEDTVIPLKFVDTSVTDVWGKLDDAQVIPDALLSVCELGNLFLLTQLTTPKQAAELIKKYVDTYKRLLKDIKDGTFEPIDTADRFERKDHYTSHEKDDLAVRSSKLDQQLKAYEGIAHANLPDTLRQYLLRYRMPNYYHNAKAVVHHHKKKIEDLLKAIEGDKKHYPKIGDMATTLAKDIVRLKPLDNKRKGKPNDAQYNTLQAKLAYLPSHKHDLADFFNELQLTNDPYQHPFLFKIKLQDCQSTLDFYARYLAELLKFTADAYAKLLSCQVVDDPRKPFKERKHVIDANILQAFKDKYAYAFRIREKRAQEKSYETAEGHLPIMLPRGLFSRAIEQAAKNKYKADFQAPNSLQSLTDLATASRAKNPTFVLQKICKDDQQPFYRYDRHIEVKDEKTGNIQKTNIAKRLEWLKKEMPDKRQLQEKILPELEKMETQKIKPSPKLELYLPLKRERDKWLDREKAIRYALNTDRLLLMMIKNRAAKRDEAIKIVFPKDTSLANVRKLLDTPTEVQLTIGNMTITDQLPIKRHGAFRRILKDRRLVGLLPYFEQEIAAMPIVDGKKNKKVVEHERVIKELEDYDHYRPTVFVKIAEFEKVLFDKYPDEMDNATPPNRIFDPSKSHWEHKQYLAIAFVKLTDEQQNELLLCPDFEGLRNAFAHNQVPNTALLLSEADGAAQILQVEEDIEQATLQMESNNETIKQNQQAFAARKKQQAQENRPASNEENAADVAGKQLTETLSKQNKDIKKALDKLPKAIKPIKDMVDYTKVRQPILDQFRTETQAEHWLDMHGKPRRIATHCHLLAELAIQQYDKLIHLLNS
jgi:hypothetical protein